MNCDLWTGLKRHLVCVWRATEGRGRLYESAREAVISNWAWCGMRRGSSSYCKTCLKNRGNGDGVEFHRNNLIPTYSVLLDHKDTARGAHHILWVLYAICKKAVVWRIVCLSILGQICSRADLPPSHGLFHFHFSLFLIFPGLSSFHIILRFLIFF